MSSNRLRRIAREIEDTARDAHSGVVLQTAGSQNDLSHLQGSIQGPPDTPYEGGQYDLDIRIPDDYPFRPPTMKFSTRIWHPNVSSQTGAICLDTLSTGWSPIFTIKSALISVQSLLASPEPKDPQDAEVAGMLLKNPQEFARVAREWAVKYAHASPSNAGVVGAGQTSQMITEGDSKREAALNRAAAYRGYSPQMVDRFCDMGFGTKTVVAAFQHVGIGTNGGQDYSLDNDLVEQITSKLFGET